MGVLRTSYTLHNACVSSSLFFTSHFSSDDLKFDVCLSINSVFSQIIQIGICYRHGKIHFFLSRTMSQLPVFKVILVGETNTGKTSIIKRYCSDEFIETNFPNAVPIKYTKQLAGPPACELSIFDTAGSEDWQAMNACVYHGTDAVIFVAAYDNGDSLYKTVTWWSQKVLPDFISLDGVVKVLAVNKCDLDDEERQITSQNHITQTKANLGADNMYLCSAKDRTNITELFEGVTELLRAKFPDRCKGLEVDVRKESKGGSCC